MARVERLAHGVLARDDDPAARFDLKLIEQDLRLVARVLRDLVPTA